METIDFDECLKDSPAYRNQLRQATIQIDLLEDRLEQMFRMCNALVNNGKIFVQDFQKFCKSLFDVRDVFASDEVVSKSLGKFSNYLREIQSLFASLLEQTTQTILRTLTRMLKDDIRKVKDQGKVFERLSTDYDTALQRNADTSKSKPHLCDDANKILVATRSCFVHTSIDYTHQINVLFDQQKVDLIELLFSYLNSHKAFFHQGYELLAIDTERDWNSINSQMTRMRQENGQKQRDLERVHETNQRRYQLDDHPHTAALLSIRENLSQASLISTPSNGSDTSKEGYLFKRSHNKFKTWNRRWFFIHHGRLLYMKRSSCTASNESSQPPSAHSILIPDLRLCTIRATNDHDRRFVFELISPQSSHLLQADSQLECDQWIAALQLTITNLFKSSEDGTFTSPLSSDDRSNTSASGKLELRQRIIQEKIDYVQSLPGNDKCCDCDAGGPEWASINLGILICLNCSGAHRGLGVGLSKVRSLHMDSWDLEILLVMSELGNTVVNSIYEARMSNEMRKPSADADPLTRRSYIEAKYVQKSFLRSISAALHQMRPSTRTIKRWAVIKGPTHPSNPVTEHDEDTSPSFRINPRQLVSTKSTASSESERVPAVSNVNVYFYEGARHHHVPMMLHALALGADKNFLNEHDHGRTPLIQTTINRSVAAAEFLLTNNAKVNLADHDGQTPLHYATRLARKGRGPIILLLKRGADPLLKDKHGVDCCSLAMNTADPDVITWYRLIALHEQMKAEDADAEKTYTSILDDPVYMEEIARTPSFS